jgi:tellurite resistance protein
MEDPVNPNTDTVPNAAGGARLRHLPIAFFSVVMGLAGLAIALQKASHGLGVPPAAGLAVLLTAALLFAVFAVLYAAKAIAHRDAVLAELRHPVRLSFFPTVSISLLLLAVGTLESAPGLSALLWFVGAPLHFAFTLFVLSRWVNHPGFELGHMTPAWFIPVVGNILVPVAGVHHAPADVSWFFFSIGLLFWIVLFTLVVYRMVFHNPLPERLIPTLFILIAPPAVGFIAYVKLTGGVDAFARILYYAALFLFLWLATQSGRVLRLRFFLSWWAYSFPMAALTVATLLMREATGLAFFQVAAPLLLLLLTLLIAVLAVATLRAVAARSICVDEG